MPRLTITTNDGVLVASYDLSDYDLSKPAARAALLTEIRDALAQARREESQSASRQ